MAEKPFSEELETWLKSSGTKTFDSFDEIFLERSFAIFLILLLAIAAIPAPTGGITHVFEVIAMLLALEMIAGRTTIWLPKRWRKHRLGSALEKKVLPFIIRRIRWFEKFSRPRLGPLLRQNYFRRLVGFIVLIFTVTAFVAPPFSGLDTLPAMGVVIIALSLILGDAVIFLMGLIIGSVGVGLVIALGGATLSLLRHIF